MTHFNELSPAEAERLALLMEECGEVIQAIGKIQRHGYESYNPDGDHSLTNRKSLIRELGDVWMVIRMMDRADDIMLPEIQIQAHKKLLKVQQYLHHQPRPTEDAK